MLNIDELQQIIMEHGTLTVVRARKIGGCELLEHINDVSGLISLLRKFRRNDIQKYDSSFTDDHPDTIEFILNRDVFFGIGGGWVYITYSRIMYFYR